QYQNRGRAIGQRVKRIAPSSNRARWRLFHSESISLGEPQASCVRRGPLGYFSSISVENLTEPSFKISTRGAVPRIPIVPTGVLTSMLPVCATSPAIKVNVPLVKLIRLELEWPRAS